jgi:uncharacterized RDD family membrane protein YckC
MAASRNPATHNNLATHNSPIRSSRAIPRNHTGQAGYMPQPGQFVPPGALPTECFGGFWIRFVAYIIDSLVLVIPSFIIGAVAGAGSYATQYSGTAGGQAAGAGAQLAANAMSLALGWLYFSLMESRYGGTLGKLAVGVRVVDEDGMFQSFGKATGRYFSKILSACIVLIGFIMAGFDPQKRALHDRIVSTFVVRKEFVHPAQRT